MHSGKKAITKLQKTRNPGEIRRTLATVSYLKSYYDEDLDLNQIYRYMDKLYSLFNGKQYEGFTMIPIIDDFRQRFDIGDDFVVVADSGLMNSDNLKLLRDAGYKYIIGGKIRNGQKPVKDWILSKEKVDGKFIEKRRENGERLIVGYSKERAKKEAYNRDQGQYIHKLS